MLAVIDPKIASNPIKLLDELDIHSITREPVTVLDCVCVTAGGQYGSHHMAFVDYIN